MTPLIGTIPGPVLPFNNHSDLNLLKIEALQARITYLLKLYNLKCAELSELHQRYADLEELCEDMAADLEEFCACGNPDARTLAALAVQEVDDARDN